MKNPFFFLAILLSLTLFSCEKEEGNGPVFFDLDENFELRIDQTGWCECGDFGLTFTDVVQDSRCPEGAICIWPGTVDVELQLHMGDNQERLQLSLLAEQDSRAVDTIGDKIIQLLAVRPYPQVDQPVDEEDYRIELRVRNL